MNLTEWILGSAAVLLWLRLEVLFHKVDVLRTEAGEWCNNNKKRLDSLALVTPTMFQVESLNLRLDKLDPPRRRATDKPKAAKR